MKSTKNKKMANSAKANSAKANTAKANRAKIFILTGEPGVGKTTLIKKLITLLNDIGMKTAGFYTEEVKNNGTREGFNVVTLDGVRGRLAREQSLLSSPAEISVGKYGVLVSEFESVALPTLTKVNDRRLCLIIDEIGKMEYHSEPFRNRIIEIFKSKFECIVLATVPVRNSDPIIAFVRNHTKAKIWKVTAENRDTVHEDIMVEIKTSVKS